MESQFHLLHSDSCQHADTFSLQNFTTLHLVTRTFDLRLLGSASFLFFALHAKQTNLGAIASSFGGAILAQTVMSRVSKRFPEDELEAKEELLNLIPNESEVVNVETKTISNTTIASISKYDWNQIVEENCLLIGGEPGSAKTSVVAGFIVPKISHAYESEIIVLDSHAKKK